MQDSTRTPRGWLITRSDVITGLLLLLIMLIGGYFRFVGLNWDDYSHLHPDERFLTEQVLRSLGNGLNLTGDDPVGQLGECMQRYPDSGGVGGFFDALCSDWNPQNTGNGRWAYGTLPVFLAKIADDFWRDAAPQLGLPYNGGHLTWRFLSALFDTGTILIAFMIGARLHNRWVGLIAAVLYAAAALPIQKAHFATVNATTAFFVALAIYFAACLQTRGGVFHYFGFGVAFAAAIAGRINVLPLVGLVIVAAALRIVPALDAKLHPAERGRIWLSNLLGLFVAGFAGFVAFRIFNPYTFAGPGFFGIWPVNARWFGEIAQSSYEVSGAYDGPPNWQWVGRINYLVPFMHMVLWGMGAAWGVTAFLSTGAALWQIVATRLRSTRNLLLIGWVIVYFTLMGGIWVTTMRYYLPLYATLAVLAAWGLYELYQRAKALRLRTPSTGWLVPAAALVGGFVIGFTLLWALMFTNIYRHQLTRVQAAHWVWEQIPADFAMRIEGENVPADTPLINVPITNCLGCEADNITQYSSTLGPGQRFTYEFVAPATGVISSVYAPHLGDMEDDSAPESLRVVLSDPTTGQTYTQGALTADFVRINHPLGDAYTIVLDTPLPVVSGSRYRFEVTNEVGGAIYVGGSVVADEGPWDDPITGTGTCTLPDNMTQADEPPPGIVNISDCRGRGYAFSTAVVPQNLYMSYPVDDELKRDAILRALDNSDYVTISSNRFYDSEARNLMRFPMTARYYEALFSGELGFELVAQFDRTFEFGPFRVSDQHLPNYTSPFWLNEWEADEAFHVYDHPAVFVFRKTDAYSQELARQILGISLEQPMTAIPRYNCVTAPTEEYCSADLVGVYNRTSLDADVSPAYLRMPPDVRAINTEGGTWSERFFRDSAINTQPLVTVIGWWLAICAYGWAAFPLLYKAFPMLADRGYGLAKIAGLLIVAWAAWFASAMRLPLWSGNGVLTCLVGLALVSLALVWRDRRAFLTFVRENRTAILWIEVITAICFLIFVGVRLTNPDLWHPAMGGEKPMDFAYFNAVLRSTVFPALDSWQAGGYLNYYYFGYVIVGSPVLLLGVIPSIAYNLILPTLFALTGIGAFSVAFNVASAWRGHKRGQTEDALAEDLPPAQRLSNPWVAGVIALLLCIVVGNLHTPLVFAEGLAQTGGFNRPDQLASVYAGEFMAANAGRAPNPGELAEINERAQRDAQDYIGSVVRGFGRLMNGTPLDLGTNRWYWGARSVIMEIPNQNDAAINEFPYFTFLYGDLHAHMIAMPLMFLVAGFLFHEVIAASLARGFWGRALPIMLLGLVVGLQLPTNTWDWITGLVLTVLGLGFAWWLRWQRVQRPGDLADAILPLGVGIGGGLLVTGMRWVRRLVESMRSNLPIETVGDDPGFNRITLVVGGAIAAFVGIIFVRWFNISRRSLVDLLLTIGGFMLVQAFVALPFTLWFASGYNSAALWQGAKTPLWAFLDMHGLFLFALYSLLIWETARWLRATRVSVLRGKADWLMISFALVVVLLLATVVLVFMGYQAALVCVPALAWIGLLFFRPGQSRAMQFILALAGLAIGLIFGVEFVVLSGDNGRQNTVFKFYIHAWLLFSVVGGVALAALLRSMDEWRGWVRVPWFLAAAALFTIAAMYPIMATRARALDRMSINTPLTLDGMEYMQTSINYELVGVNRAQEFALSSDYDAIRWMQDNVQGSPVIMEAMGVREYLWNGRFAIYTGLPTVAGWRYHQTQQRTLPMMGEMVNFQVANANAFYFTQDPEEAWSILQHYDVAYVIVGELERARYIVPSPDGLTVTDGLAKIERMAQMGLLEVAYQNEGTTIYRVNQDAVYPGNVGG